MAETQLVVSNVRFPSGEVQTEAANVWYFGYASCSFSGSANFLLIPANFTPNLPASITVIPWIFVVCGQANSSAPGSAASVFGFQSTPGSPFNGTSPGGYALYRNAQINDNIVVAGSANNGGGGSGSGNWVIIALLKK